MAHVVIHPPGVTLRSEVPCVGAPEIKARRLVLAVRYHSEIGNPGLDELFGCAEWREGIDMPDSQERRRFFFDLYTGQLGKAGAKHVVHFELYKGGRLVYAIFFATTHWMGANLMKAAIWKVAPFGEFEFRGTHVDQPTLGLLEPDFSPLRKSLSDRFSGNGWVAIADVEEFVGSDKTDYHTGQVRKGALIPMERADEIEV